MILGSVFVLGPRSLILHPTMKDYRHNADSRQNIPKPTMFPLLSIPSKDAKFSNRRRADTARVREKWLRSKAEPIDAFGDLSASTYRRRHLPVPIMQRQLVAIRNARSATALEWMQSVKPEVLQWKKEFEEKFRHQVAKKNTAARPSYARTMAPNTPPERQIVTGKNNHRKTHFYYTNLSVPPGGAAEMKGRYIVAPGWCSEGVSWKSFQKDRTVSEMHRHTLF